MYREDILSGVSVLKDQPMVGGDSILDHRLVPPSLDVVVADDQMKPSILVESMKQVEDALMSSADRPEASMLP